MPILEMSAEIEKEFIDNWDTFTSPDVIPINFPDRHFSSDSLTQYIALQFNALQDDVIGFNGTTSGRVEYAGVIKIACYHKTKKLCLKLADTVTDFLRGKELPLGIKISGNSTPSSTKDLDNDFFELIVSFDVRQC